MSQSNDQLGLVYRKEQGIYHVDHHGETVLCSISSKLRKQLVYPEADPASLGHHAVATVARIRAADPVAIGDRVRFESGDPGRGVIQEVLPRRNRLARKVAGRRKLEQVVVANVDQVVPVFAAARPAPKWNLLDRYLVSAEAAGFPALICITKMDLAEEGTLLAEVSEYRRIGYSVLLTSAQTGRGIEPLRRALAGRSSVLVGKSGVGKSSLLNVVQPGLELPVREVGHGTGKGRHTTTHLEMHRLEGGGGVVDTPGMREFGFLEPVSDPAAYFPEMRPFIGGCRFERSCTHTHEPDCALKSAVETGKVSPRRYRSFLKIRGG